MKSVTSKAGAPPRGPLPLARHAPCGLPCSQAGPHASGCDEPGQIGRSSPKSFPRVPWQARPFCALGAPKGRTCHPFARRLRLAFTGRHWPTLLAGSRFRRLPRSLLHHPVVAHMVSPALLRLWRDGRMVGWSDDRMVGVGTSVRAAFRASDYRTPRPSDTPARHTEYKGHSAQVLRFRTPGQSPRMPRWLRAKS